MYQKYNRPKSGAHITLKYAEMLLWRRPLSTKSTPGCHSCNESVTPGFAEAELVPPDGHPGIWGYYDAGADKTLVSSQTSVNTLLVQASLSVFKKSAGDITVQPRVAGSAPFYQFTKRLGLPLVPTGLGFGTGAYTPNEIILIKP